MSTPHEATDSRRGFLRQMLAAAPVAVAGGLFASPAQAADADAVRPLRVGGLRIADHVVGGVVVQGEEYDYLLFDADQLDRRGRAAASGTGVVRLTNCVEWRIRMDGDQHLKGWAADPSDLDACQTYEVFNSSWVADLIDDNPALAGLRSPPLHHCVFTFRETQFECVLAAYDVLLHTGSFADLYKSLS